MKLSPVLAALASCVVNAQSTTCTSVSDLPVIFFHGLGFTSSAGDTFVNNLAAENRTAVSLSFCTDSCSFESLATQVPLAVAAVREIVANNSAYDNGYIFLAHSQGGTISRAVIEEMDDHKVKRYISLAGVQNGIFPGPDDADGLAAAGTGVLQHLMPRPDIFNFSAYAPEDAYGKVQRDVVQFTLENPELQYEYTYFNLLRSPQFGSWASSNVFFPVVNNVNPCLPGNDQCIFDQRRRKANFLKLESAHFITSPEDGSVTPWQSSHFGRYSEVSSIDAIKKNFSNLVVVEMKDTLEYTSDTFGLRTLDERGGLFLPTVANVTHACWVQDDNDCLVQDTYDTYVYPLLH
ncbi:holo-[acyl-carrier-protein] synthase [Phytophthora boehmeriae]|uniref:Holo-[acyl-carrier-protein] synthase n=1 Tax=Phytophthora boehmeriae TaxID=109152 RepID=A0A8T1WT02_9STRA|nr:holo-[acyl-carrier-protein] synthase [Phytophthora boehmeriae]